MVGDTVGSEAVGEMVGATLRCLTKRNISVWTSCKMASCQARRKRGAGGHLSPNNPRVQFFTAWSLVSQLFSNNGCPPIIFPSYGAANFKDSQMTLDTSGHSMLLPTTLVASD